MKLVRFSDGRFGIRRWRWWRWCYEFMDFQHGGWVRVGPQAVVWTRDTLERVLDIIDTGRVFESSPRAVQRVDERRRDIGPPPPVGGKMTDAEREALKRRAS